MRLREIQGFSKHNVAHGQNRQPRPRDKCKDFFTITMVHSKTDRKASLLKTFIPKQLTWGSVETARNDSELYTVQLQVVYTSIRLETMSAGRMNPRWTVQGNGMFQRKISVILFEKYWYEMFWLMHICQSLAGTTEGAYVSNLLDHRCWHSTCRALLCWWCRCLG